MPKPFDPDEYEAWVTSLRVRRTRYEAVAVHLHHANQARSPYESRLWELSWKTQCTALPEGVWYLTEPDADQPWHNPLA